MAPPHNNMTEACGEFAKCANIILQFKTDQSTLSPVDTILM